MAKRCSTLLRRLIGTGFVASLVARLGPGGLLASGAGPGLLVARIIRLAAGFVGGRCLGIGRREIDPRQAVAGVGHFLINDFELTPQHQLAPFEHREQLLGGHDVELISLALADVRAGRQRAVVGGLQRDDHAIADLRRKGQGGVDLLLGRDPFDQGSLVGRSDSLQILRLVFDAVAAIHPARPSAANRALPCRSAQS